MHLDKKRVARPEATNHHQGENSVPSPQPTDLLAVERPTTELQDGGSPARAKARNFTPGKRASKEKKSTAYHTPRHRRACRSRGLRRRASLLRRLASPRTCPGRGTVAPRDPDSRVILSHSLSFSLTAGKEARRTSCVRNAKDSPGRAGGRTRGEGRKRAAMESEAEAVGEGKRRYLGISRICNGGE